MEKIFEYARKNNISDIHIIEGERIYFRKDGEIVAYEDSQSLSREDILKICSGKFEEDKKIQVNQELLDNMKQKRLYQEEEINKIFKKN